MPSPNLAVAAVTASSSPASSASRYIFTFRPHHAILIPVSLITGLTLFEQFRWWWNKSHRRRAVRGHWEEIVDLSIGAIALSAEDGSHRKKRKRKLLRVKKRAAAAKAKALALSSDSPATVAASVASKGSVTANSFVPLSPPASPVNVARPVLAGDGEVCVEDVTCPSPLSESSTVVALSTTISSSASSNSPSSTDLVKAEQQESTVMRFRQKLFHSLVVFGRFVNPWLEWEDRNVGDFLGYLSWQLTRTCRNGVPKEQEILNKELPVVQPDRLLWTNFHEVAKNAALTPYPRPPIMSFTWFGQSTCLVQMDGYNILTDPIFSSRTVGEWVGPRRLQRVPCPLEDLPHIDIVLVSHNHYDHLEASDLVVVRKLANTVTWYIPKGLRKWFGSLGVTRVIELDWWEETLHHDLEKKDGYRRPDLQIIGTPIQHWSGRHFLDVNATLWSSFLVKGPSASFYHCGDTGYCSAFKEIGRRYGPVTLAAIPIGSYEPREYMKHQHIDPVEAVQIHQDLQCQHSVGVHWGTFMMSDEHYLEPPAVFEAEGRKRKLPKGSVMATTLGESIIVRGGEGGVTRGRGAREWKMRIEKRKGPGSAVSRMSPSKSGSCCGGH
ncbi:hypothetical protein HDU67_004552 [Dinochytrium kinnereticum]|nr:hypothetical protein HDU67_004552 [Dinochytrium kinnereticum]